jgi:hypothetical protein
MHVVTLRVWPLPSCARPKATREWSSACNTKLRGLRPVSSTSRARKTSHPAQYTSGTYKTFVRHGVASRRLAPTISPTLATATCPASQTARSYGLLVASCMYTPASLSVLAGRGLAPAPELRRRRTLSAAATAVRTVQQRRVCVLEAPQQHGPAQWATRPAAQRVSRRGSKAWARCQACHTPHELLTCTGSGSPPPQSATARVPAPPPRRSPLLRHAHGAVVLLHEVRRGLQILARGQVALDGRLDERQLGAAPALCALAGVGHLCARGRGRWGPARQSQRMTVESQGGWGARSGRRGDALAAAEVLSGAGSAAAARVCRAGAARLGSRRSAGRTHGVEVDAARWVSGVQALQLRDQALDGLRRVVQHSRVIGATGRRLPLPCWPRHRCLSTHIHATRPRAAAKRPCAGGIRHARLGSTWKYLRVASSFMMCAWLVVFIT